MRGLRVAGLPLPRYVFWWVVFTTAALLAAAEPRYSALQTGDVIRLQDAKTQTHVSLIPSVGNVAFDMTVKGEQILRFPYASVEEFKKAPRLSGIPFLAPWANRLDELGFYANGQHYAFNTELGNVRGPHPIHGLLSSAAIHGSDAARARCRVPY